MFAKQVNRSSYFTAIARSSLLQQIFEKNNRIIFCQCLLVDFCLSLEQLLCCFMDRESYSAGSLDNNPSGHSICRSSQKQTHVVASCCFVCCPLSYCKDKQWLSGERGKRRKTQQGAEALCKVSKTGALMQSVGVFNFEQKYKESQLYIYTHFNQAQSAACVEGKLC